MDPAAVAVAQKTSVATEDSVAEVQWSVLNLHLLDQFNTSSPPLNPSRNCIPQSGGHVIWWHIQLDILCKLMQ
jgi:hypothetical protein